MTLLVTSGFIRKDKGMLNIKNNIIYLTKGDSAALTVDLIQEDGTHYRMQRGDKLVMTIRKRPTSPVLLQIDSTSNVLDFLPKETKKLDTGSCVFDIELRMASGDIFTVVGLQNLMQSNMVVLPEISI